MSCDKKQWDLLILQRQLKKSKNEKEKEEIREKIKKILGVNI